MSESMVAHAPSSSLAALHLATERMAAPAIASVASWQGAHPVGVGTPTQDYLAAAHSPDPPSRAKRRRRWGRIEGHTAHEFALSRQLSPFLFHASHWQCSHRFAFSNWSLWFLFFSFCPIYTLLKWYQQRRNPASFY
jgi:hypothetical protein